MSMGDIGKKILREYKVDINNVCPMEFYQGVLEEADEIRSRLIRELMSNIPECLR